MLESIGQHVKKIQSSSEETKKWWVISSSTVIGLIVIFIWTSYIQSALTLSQPIKQIPTTTAPVADLVTPTKSGEGILGTLGKGSIVVYDDAVSGATNLWKRVTAITSNTWSSTVGWVSSIFKGGREFSIEPDAPTFIPQTPNEPVPPTPINSNR